MRKIYILLLIAILSSCIDKEAKKLHSVIIGYELPDGVEDISLDGQEVYIRNTTSNRTYVSNFNSGICEFELETGLYSISTSFFSDKTGNLNATINEINISDILDNSVVLEMGYVYSSPIIIEEIYYSGAKSPLNKNYIPDQFVKLYNNSSTSQSLRGLCLATIVGSSNSPSKWIDEKGNLLSYLPINQTAWRFPDNNCKLVLEPGESIVVAQDAINHSDPSISTSKVDLSNADFETFARESGKDYDNLGVENMELIWSKSDRIPDWMLTPFGPPVVLFRLPENYKDYVGNIDNIKSQPGSFVKYFCIPKTFVLDAVECVRSAERNHKRLHNELDAGYVYVSQPFKGYSVRRIIQRTDGDRVVYMDTNNSSADFITDQQPSPIKQLSNNNREY